MKIVHVLPALSKGGAERVTAELANHAAVLGHTVTIISAYPVDSALLRDGLHPQVDVRYVSTDIRRRLRKYFSIVPWIWRNRSWIADQDVLHCHLTYGSVFGSLVKRLRSLYSLQRPAIVETYHGVGMAVAPAHLWLHAHLAADHDALALMVEHDYWTRFLSRRPTLRWQIIPNGITVAAKDAIDPERSCAYRREIGIPDERRIVVGTIGMLRPDRRPWNHLPVFADIRRSLGDEVHFVIFGEGPELERMRTLIKEYELEGRVHLPGLAANMRMPLSIMDLYIGVNVGPTTGMAALEAALCGVAVIGIQMYPDYQAAPDDWIWSSPELPEVAGRAVSLLNCTSDRQRLAQQQTEYAFSHHSVEAMATAYYKLYDSARETRRKSTPLANTVRSGRSGDPI